MKKYNGKHLFLSAGLCLLACPSPAATSSQDLLGGPVRFYGRIIAQPCSVSLDSLDMRVDMNVIDVKTLYANGHSKPVPFFIRLTGCKPAVFKSVRTKFSGPKDVTLPGTLAVGGMAKGIALQLLDHDATRLQLDELSRAVPLQGQELVLAFAAQVDGYPDRIASHNIVVGEFSAVTTFTLQYD
ncbi:fimbrial protein [Aeromonas finlandensis]|uniref:fimbrial protein n=1 Tax=Aeromonas finlandensis TaxID=1543375 RepID=UPI00138DFB36|nr:fimbrial protein [Aeromonas finlandensis]